YVLPALRVAAARDVRVRQLVEQQELRLSRQRLVDVELAEDLIDVDDGLARYDVQALDERFGLTAPVRLDEADDDVAPLGLGDLRAVEHGVSLADARCGAEKDLQPSPTAR